MNRPLRTRLQALLLATILVVSGIALPAYDAAVYHSGRAHQSGPVRFEPGDEGTAHILLCALGPQFNRSRGVLPGPTPHRFHCEHESVPVQPLQAVAPVAAPSSLHRSRAPPERAD